MTPSGSMEWPRPGQQWVSTGTRFSLSVAAASSISGAGSRSSSSPWMSSTGGRLLLSPNEIAIKFDRELGSEDAEMELVLFLDGSAVGEVSKRSAEEFRSSWSRPKWHIVFQEEEGD